MSPRTPRFVVSWVAAGALTFVGVVAVIVGLSTPVDAASFGWFAYQPLAAQAFVPRGGGVFVSSMTLAGFAASALGAIALAFLAGRRLATRPGGAASRPQLGE